MNRKILAVLLSLVLILGLLVPVSLATPVNEEELSSPQAEGESLEVESLKEAPLEAQPLEAEPLEEEPEVDPNEEGPTSGLDAEDDSEDDRDDLEDGTSQDGVAGDQDTPPISNSPPSEQDMALEKPPSDGEVKLQTEVKDEGFSNEPELFEQVMACKTYEEIKEILYRITDTEWNLFTNEQIEEIDKLFAELDPTDATVVVIEKSEPPVVSELVIPVVNFTYVAPFLEPVVGGKD